MWWGHPITSCIDSIDYFIRLEDEVLDADSHYCEQLIRMDNINTMNLPKVGGFYFLYALTCHILYSYLLIINHYMFVT